MPAVRNSFSPRPYQNKSEELLHSGIVAVTGSAVVDLGIGHNNFVPSLDLNAALAAGANNASTLSWAHGPQLGQFTIYAWKATAAGVTTLIAATVAVNVSFTVIADSSVG
jgi:hypothetical protein